METLKTKSQMIERIVELNKEIKKLKQLIEKHKKDFSSIVSITKEMYIDLIFRILTDKLNDRVDKYYADNIEEVYLVNGGDETAISGSLYDVIQSIYQEIIIDNRIDTIKNISDELNVSTLKAHELYNNFKSLVELLNLKNN